MFFQNSLVICKRLASNFYLLNFLRKIFNLVIFTAYFSLMLLHCFLVQFRQFLIPA